MEGRARPPDVLAAGGHALILSSVVNLVAGAVESRAAPGAFAPEDGSGLPPVGSSAR